LIRLKIIFIYNSHACLDECKSDLDGKVFVDLGSGIGQVSLQTKVERRRRMPPYLVGLHDGCCSVKCIEVCCLLCKDYIFVSINKLLQVLWNRNNEKSSELR
jgi:hypothetical protein